MGTLAVIGAASMTGTALRATLPGSLEWTVVFKGRDGSIIYLRTEDFGASLDGREIWVKAVEPNGAWLLNRAVIDCERHRYDTRQILSYDAAGKLTYSYDAADLEHNWSGNAPDTAGAALESFACVKPS